MSIPIDPLATVPDPTRPAGGPSDDWPTVPGYELLERLEAGGMGVVYRARQVGLNRTVALKVLRGGAHAGSQERARFRVEAEAVAALAHAHIIPIFDCGECAGLPYLAMEFADGGSLAGHLAGGPLPPGQAAELVETLARAVQFVHDHGIIHRDLKPANVLFTGDGVPRLADFGLAKRLDDDQGLTRTHAVLGTAGYMAPEQAAGKHDVGPAADVYALGAILYEALTGRPPFRAGTFELTVHQVVTEEPPPPTRLRPEIPAELDAVCLKCLEKDPARRFASALALADDLRRFLNGEPVSTQPLDTFERHARVAQRAGYEILDTVYAGPLGIVYRARQLRLGRVVALEMLAAPELLDPAGLARLQAVGEARAQLHHPNVVVIYDVGEYNGELYVAREHVDGGSLADVRDGPARPAEQSAALVETLARAVHHAHQHGLVHGSLKLGKVLLGTDGVPKITGFGLAGVLSAAPSASDPATDVHALGAILYELLTGRPAAPEPPRHWRPEVPEGLEAVCLKCLAPDPARRYPSAAALAEDLRRFRSGEVLFIDDLDEPTQQRRWARRAGFEIVEVLGRDRDGFTYKVRQLALDRVVVLKRVPAADRFVPAAKARFRREAQQLAMLRHPNVVRVFDHGEQSDLAYYVREYVDGPSLAEAVAGRPLPADTAAAVVEGLARALHAAHAQGATHGGLNPDRVRLTPAGVPKITSFRRTRLAGDEHRRAAGYVAPEQLDVRMRMLSPAADVYALGALLYTLLTGQPPFGGSTLAEVMGQVRSQLPRPCGADVAPELAAICMRCMEKQAGRRPGSAAALADEVRQYLSD